MQSLEILKADIFVYHVYYRNSAHQPSRVSWSDSLDASLSKLLTDLDITKPPILTCSSWCCPKATLYVVRM